MKKLVLVLLVLQLISIVSAVEINLSKESYAPFETLQAEIYGNFIDGLKVENIHFYRERNIPLIYDILKLGNKYLLYALLPSTEGNYTLKIKDIRYETPSGVSTEDIIKEFNVKSTNETPLTINPGFIVTRDDFYIKIEANKNTEIEAEFLGEKQTLSLVQNKEKKVYFSVSEINNYTETNIKINNYNIPVFVFPETSSDIKETSKFRFNPSEIETIISKEDSYSFKVSLINLGNKNITDITLSSNISDLVVGITPDFISELEAEGREFINLTISSEEAADFSGKIIASSENLSAELQVDIKIVENKSDIIYNGDHTPGYTEDETCEDLGGKICSAEEKCNIPLELTQDGYCCKGECIVEEEGDTSWIYGVIIMIAVLAGLIFLSFYMKKRQKIF